MRRILAIAAVLTTRTIHAQPPSYVPTNGLVGWWPFNGNANDESGNGNNGVINPGTNGSINFVNDRNGNVASSTRFVSNPVWNSLGPYIEISNSNNLLTSSDFTINYWINVDANNQNGEIINKGADNLPGVFISRINTTILQSGITSSGAINQNNFPYLIWKMISISKDGSSMLSLYIDGILEQQVQCGDITNLSSPYYLGAMVSGGTNGSYYPFQGSLDDVGFWNRALTPAEIQALYNAQPLTPCVSPDPVSFTGLGSSYTLADAPVALVGSPAGGVFLGPGVTGSTFDPAAAGVGVHSIQYVYVDGNDCVNAAGQCTDVTVNAGVGGSNMTTGGVRVFPNPNRGQFTVELELTGLVGMQVFDARGALVHNEVFTASGSRTQRTLDLSTLAKGSYTLLLEHDGQRISQTVVVE
jgi:hypothetical protein